MTPRDRAIHLIEGTSHLTLASADDSGKPWVSPVSFVHEDHQRFYWVSSRSARHSHNIRVRPEISIVIFTTQPADGLYIDAIAEELTDPDDVRRGIELLKTRPQPERFVVGSPEDVTGGAAWRIYRATSASAYLREDDRENGQAVTVRRRVDLGG